MKHDHAQYADWLPEYAAGGLDAARRETLEAHLRTCAACQADLTLWKSVASEVRAADAQVAAPVGLVDQALGQAWIPPQAPQRAQKHWSDGLRRAWVVLRSQAPLVHREIWPASAAVIGIGFIAAVMSDSAGAVHLLAPLASAGCIAVIYGPENDPAMELALATPTSARQILLARLALVFGYNLVLALVASLGLLPFLPHVMLGSLVLGWLGPMAFLSAAALVLSLYIGTSNALWVAYIAWLAQIGANGSFPSLTVLGQQMPLLLAAMGLYRSFWANPVLMLGLAAVLAAAALWLVGKQDVRQAYWA